MIPWPWLIPAFLLGSFFGFAGLLRLIIFIGSLWESRKNPEVSA